MQRVRHGDGAHHPADSQRLSCRSFSAERRGTVIRVVGLAIDSAIGVRGVWPGCHEPVLVAGGRGSRRWQLRRPADATAQPDPVFTALLLDGRTESGRLVSLGPGAITLASAEGAKHELPLDRVFKLTREAAEIGCGDRSFDDRSCRRAIA